MLRKVGNYFALAGAYIKLNFAAQLEYRGAFFSQAAAMLVNDIFRVVFWILFFTKFKALRGWHVEDVITIWALTAAGFGLAYGICGNALNIAGLILRGQLDAWMLYPRVLVSHIILGRMSATAWGDAVFGFGIYILLVKPDFAHLVVFSVLSVSAALLMIGFSILTGSLGFYLGNAEGVAEQWRFALITFATYPATLFDGWVKVILFTLIPAAFISYLPIEALHGLSWGYLALSILGSLLFLFMGSAAFYLGLKRYESGNLMEMRG